MGLRLDKALATALGVEYSENATPEEMANLTQQTYDKYQKEYEDSFAKAYGKKDVKALAEAYVLKQQQGVANIEMGLNIASMALMVVPGGAVATSGWALKGALLAKHSATGAKVVKGLQLVDKAKTFVKGAQTLQRISQVASPFIMANMTLRPTELLEQLTSKNGMSAEEWKAWGQGVLQNSVYMVAGMGASKLAETGAAMYKTKALVSTLKSAGKSTDEIVAMIKANPVKFPNEIVKSLSKIDNLAKGLQVSTEIALDIGSTILVNKALGNGDLLPMDVINSIAFAISGGVLQKQFTPLSTEAKVSFIEKALKEYGVTKVEAERILKTMDDISAGKIRAKDIKPLESHNSFQMLDEVVVTAKRSEILAKNTQEDDSAITAILKKQKQNRAEKENSTNFQTDNLTSSNTSGYVDEFGQIHRKPPRGYVIDYKTGQPIKVNINKATIEVSEKSISISDEFGNLLGQVSVDGGGIILKDGSKALHFEGLVSNVEGVGIGTKLIQELVKISEARGFEGRLIATASSMRADKLTNLGFYYKLGFKATDPQKHAAILDYIKNNKEIPLDLNHNTEIVFIPKKNPATTIGEPVVKSNDKSINTESEIQHTVIDKSHVEIMSDAEFNQLKAKIESNPSFPEPDFFGMFPKLSKENILFVEMLLENTELVKKLDTNQLRRIINGCYTDKASKAKTILLEKFQSNPDLINNPYIVARLEAIFSGIETVESLKGLDILLANPKLLMIPNISSLLNRLNNEYSVKAFEKILTIPEFLSNFNDIERILYITNNEYSFKFLEQIFEIPEMLKLDLNLVSDLIKNTELDIVNITKLELFNDWIKNSENLSNKELTSCFLRGLSEELERVDEYKYLQKNGEGIQSNLDYGTIQRGNVFQNVLESFTKEFPEFSNKYYDIYLEKAFLQYIPAEANRFKQMCISINEEYGVKVLLPSDLKEVGQSLILIYQELNNYKMHSKGSAKMPPILSFITPLADKVAGIAYIYDTNNVGIRELKIDFIKHGLRHEMTHINDTKQLEIFPTEIRRFKAELGDEYTPNAKFDVHKDLDINNCKFADELRNAGLCERLIEYAYTNPKEFLAVASQGDFSKYSPEFKSYLVELGMPEWMLNFQNLKPFFINGDIKVVDNITTESITKSTANPRIINSEDNISPSKTIQIQEEKKAFSLEAKLI